MKRLYVICLILALCQVKALNVMAQSSSVDLKGIWQMCFYVSATPDSPGELKPSNSFKILGGDGTFTNMTMIPNKGAIILGSGTYKQTSPNVFVEHVEKNLHLPQLVGQDNVLEFEMKGKDVMVLKFFVKQDKNGNEINSWYYENWKRVSMPAEYPKDLQR